MLSIGTADAGCGTFLAMRLHHYLPAALLLIAGCPGIGERTLADAYHIDFTPTWTSHVREILDHHCVTCHRIPPAEGATDDFRLDRYDAEDDPADTPGAFETAARIRARAVLQRSMPPDGRVPERELAILDAWVRAGAPR